MSMLTSSARSSLAISPIDNQLFGEQYLSKMKDAAVADKLIRSFTTSFKSDSCEIKYYE